MTAGCLPLEITNHFTEPKAEDVTIEFFHSIGVAMKRMKKTD